MGLIHPLISRAFSAFIVHSQKLEKDQAEISNLQVGTYVFQLTVTDTAQQQDFTNITIIVLNSEQTEGEPTDI